MEDETPSAAREMVRGYALDPALLDDSSPLADELADEIDDTVAASRARKAAVPPAEPPSD
jgi:hypothetical protein